jgi:hypothetical protein
MITRDFIDGLIEFSAGDRQSAVLVHSAGFWRDAATYMESSRLPQKQKRANRYRTKF